LEAQKLLTWTEFYLSIFSFAARAFFIHFCLPVLNTFYEVPESFSLRMNLCGCGMCTCEHTHGVGEASCLDTHHQCWENQGRLSGGGGQSFMMSRREPCSFQSGRGTPGYGGGTPRPLHILGALRPIA
jgi:hypothetical protein